MSKTQQPFDEWYKKLIVKCGLKEYFSPSEAAEYLTEALGGALLSEKEVYLLAASEYIQLSYVFEGGYVLDGSRTGNPFRVNRYPSVPYIHQHLSDKAVLLSQSGELTWYVADQQLFNEMDNYLDEDGDLPGRFMLQGFLVDHEEISRQVIKLEMSLSLSKYLWLAAYKYESELDKTTELLFLDPDHGEEIFSWKESEDERNGRYILCPAFESFNLSESGPRPVEKCINASKFDLSKVVFRADDLCGFAAAYMININDTGFMRDYQRKSEYHEYVVGSLPAVGLMRGVYKEREASSKSSNAQNKVIALLLLICT